VWRIHAVVRIIHGCIDVLDKNARVVGGRSSTHGPLRTETNHGTRGTTNSPAAGDTSPRWLSNGLFSTPHVRHWRGIDCGEWFDGSLPAYIWRPSTGSTVTIVIRLRWLYVHPSIMKRMGTGATSVCEDTREDDRGEHAHSRSERASYYRRGAWEPWVTPNMQAAVVEKAEWGNPWE
jgi:hypothetical protein